MELRKIKKRLTAAYNYSFIRMTLNFYTCYEMMAERPANRQRRHWLFNDRYLGSLGSFLKDFWKRRKLLRKKLC